MNIIYNIGKHSYKGRNIVSYKMKQRMFCLTDRDKPYNFEIIYKHLHDVYEFETNIIGYATVCDMVDSYKYTATDVIRMNEKECLVHITNLDNILNIIKKEEIKLSNDEIIKYGYTVKDLSSDPVSDPVNDRS